MDFELPENLQKIKDKVKRFVEQELEPISFQVERKIRYQKKLFKR